MSIAIPGQNSLVSEIEFFQFLDIRLNADSFNYFNAILETGVTDDQVLIKYLNKGKDATNIADIKEELDAYVMSSNGAYTYSLSKLTEAFNILSVSGTTAQTKAAQSLIQATSLIDSYEFLGKPTDKAQKLSFPRKDIRDKNGLTIASDTVPYEIKKATCELALHLLQNGEIYSNITAEKVGDSLTSFQIDPARKKLPNIVLDYMRPFLVEKSDFSAPLIF